MSQFALRPPRPELASDLFAVSPSVSAPLLLLRLLLRRNRRVAVLLLPIVPEPQSPCRRLPPTQSLRAVVAVRPSVSASPLLLLLLQLRAWACVPPVFLPYTGGGGTQQHHPQGEREQHHPQRGEEGKQHHPNGKGARPSGMIEIPRWRESNHSVSTVLKPSCLFLSWLSPHRAIVERLVRRGLPQGFVVPYQLVLASGSGANDAR